MTRTKILLLCGPLAAGGLALAVHATSRVNRLDRDLAAVAIEGRAAGASFVATLQGEHAERQRLAFDRRRDLTLRLAAARRDRLLGLLGVAAAGLVGGALGVMARISAEIEEDRRHVRAGRGEHGPERS
jgi:hypothetical protein